MPAALLLIMETSQYLLCCAVLGVLSSFAQERAG